MRAVPALEQLYPDPVLRRASNARKARRKAVDYAIALAELAVLGFCLLIAAVALTAYTWTRLALEATLPLSLLLAVCYARTQQRKPTLRTFDLPNAIELPGGKVWQFSTRDLQINLRWQWSWTVWGLIGAGVALTIGLAFDGLLPLAGLASTFGLWRAARRQQTVVHHPPHHADRLRRGMAQTGLWPDGKLPPFNHLRPPVSDDHGTTIWITLNGMPYYKLDAKKRDLAAGLGITDRMIRLDNEGLNADEVRLRFNSGRPRSRATHWALDAVQQQVTE